MNDQHRIYFQYALQDSAALPHESTMTHWLNTALQDRPNRCEITVRFVDPDESAVLNLDYRQHDYPTNVLSFPIHEMLPDGYCLLGDIAICVNLVFAEARAQEKNFTHHLAHLLIHGCLHLSGYDHENDTDADCMENKEIALLSSLGITNPYET